MGKREANRYKLDVLLFYILNTDFTEEKIAYILDISLSFLHAMLNENDFSFGKLREQRNIKIQKEAQEIREKALKQNYQKREQDELYFIAALISALQEGNFDSEVFNDIRNSFKISKSTAKTILKKHNLLLPEFENCLVVAVTSEPIKKERLERKMLKIMRYSTVSLEDLAKSMGFSRNQLQGILNRNNLKLKELRQGVYDYKLGL